MKNTWFTLETVDDMDAWTVFLADQTKTIVREFFSPRTETHPAGIYYVYMDADDVAFNDATILHDEQAHLRTLCKIAGDIRDDAYKWGVYSGLKNDSEREMFLLLPPYEQHDKDASSIIQLLKPEMACVLEWGRLLEWGRSS